MAARPDDERDGSWGSGGVPLLFGGSATRPVGTERQMGVCSHRLAAQQSEGAMVVGRTIGHPPAFKRKALWVRGGGGNVQQQAALGIHRGLNGGGRGLPWWGLVGSGSSSKSRGTSKGGPGSRIGGKNSVHTTPAEDQMWQTRWRRRGADERRLGAQSPTRGQLARPRWQCV